MKRTRCDLCQHKLDCLANNSCVLDNKLVSQLNGILAKVYSDFMDKYYPERYFKVTLRELIVIHEFEKNFRGSRVQRRAQARAFIRRYARQVYGWQLSANRNSFKYGGKW